MICEKCRCEFSPKFCKKCEHEIELNRIDKSRTVWANFIKMTNNIPEWLRRPKDSFYGYHASTAQLWKADDGTEFLSLTTEPPKLNRAEMIIPCA